MPAREISRRLASLGAPRQAVSAGQVKVMLAEIREEPFSAQGWIFELKHDGFRLLAAREQGRARLVYRRGQTCARCAAPAQVLSETNAVDELEGATHLRGEVLDVGEVVPVQLVADVVGAERDRVDGVAAGDLV
jgi:ATP-dependent DNA ligase